MKSRKKDEVDKFVTGGSSDSGNTNSKRGRPKKEQTLSTFTTRIQDRYLKKLKAFAYYKRVSQREVIEKALQEFFDGRGDELEEAMELYEQDNPL